eukprot:EG_transcript_5058
MAPEARRVPHIVPWLDSRTHGCRGPLAWLQRPLGQRGLPYQFPLYSHAKCVNTIRFSNGDHRLLLSGSDDQKVYIWDVFDRPQRLRPTQALQGHTGIVLCAVWDWDNRHVASCGTDEAICHFDPSQSSSPIHRFEEHDDVVQKVSFRPEDSNLFVSASNDSTLRLWDCRAPASQGAIFGLCAFSAVAFCPTSDNHFLSCDQASGLLLWDLRQSFGPSTNVLGSLASAQRAKKRAIRSYRPVYRHRSGFLMTPEVSAVDFNRDGSMFVCSVRKAAPLVFRTAEATPFLECHAPGYSNKVTQKTASFIGDDDEMVACGSDDWGVYVWALEDLQPSSGEPVTHDISREEQPWSNARHLVPRPRHVLRGHQSIVNGVAWNASLPLLATAGVERVIRLWQPFPFTEEDSRHSTTPVQLRQPYESSEVERIARMTPPAPLEGEAGLSKEQLEEMERHTLALFDYYTERYQSDSDADPSLDFSGGSDSSSEGLGSSPPGGEGEEGADAPTSPDGESSSSISFEDESGDSQEWVQEQRLFRRAAAWQAMRALAREGNTEALQGLKGAVTQQSLWDMLDAEVSDTSSNTSDLLRRWPPCAEEEEEGDSEPPAPAPPPAPRNAGEALADHQWAVQQCRRAVVRRFGPPRAAPGPGALPPLSPGSPTSADPGAPDSSLPAAKRRCSGHSRP